MDKNELTVSLVGHAAIFSTVHRTLKEFDEAGDSLHFIELALESLPRLSADLKLLTIYHGWKSGKLGLVRTALDDSTDLQEPSDMEAFLHCHELRIQGAVKESFAVLEKLAQHCQAQIVQYRYVAEYLDMGEIKKAMRLIESLLPQLPLNRRRALEFNYGMAANNISNFSIVEKVLETFAQNKDELSNFFFHWLSGAYYSQRGESSKSLDHYLMTLDLAQLIPSRSTDISIVAFGALREAFWIGSLEKARLAYNIIKHAAKEKKSSVGINRFTLCTALMEFLEGKILSAARHFRVLYSENDWGYDHLQGGTAYLWALTATGKAADIISVVPKLEKIRKAQSVSADLFNFDLFVIYARYLTGEITESESSEQILRFCQTRSHAPQSFHNDWANGLLLLFQQEPFEKLKSVIHFKSYPLLQRAIVWALANSPILSTALYWHYISKQCTDSTSQAMSEFRLAQLTGDILGLVKSTKRLNGQGALSWLSSMDFGLCQFTAMVAQQVTSSHFVLDYGSHRVVATSSEETLDSQPQLAELFLLLASSPRGCGKEEIATNLGFKNYDPLQHDPPIYNMLSRLRDWLKKHDAEAEILRVAEGWRIGFAHHIVTLGNSPNSSVSANAAKIKSSELMSSNTLVGRQTNIPAPTLTSDFDEFPPRLAWICEQLRWRKTITRADLLQNFNIKKSTAANDFNDLINQGLVKRYGSGRGIYYRLIEKETP